MDSYGMDSNGERPPSSPVPAEDLVDWLCSLHLPQYAMIFAQAGLRSLDELRGLTLARLQEVGDFPTGHHRRILRSLEALGMEKVEDAACVEVEERGEERREEAGAARELTLGPSRRKPVPRPRRVFLKDRKRDAASLQHSRQESTASMEAGSTKTLPARTRARANPNLKESKSPPGAHSGALFSSPSSLTVPRLPPRTQTRSTSPSSFSGSTTHSSSSSNESLSISSHSLPSDLDNVLEEPAPSCSVPAPRSPHSAPSSLLDIPPSAQMDTQIPLGNVQEEFLMVENDIYEMATPRPASAGFGPRNTRSYRLRHRPVPELPDQALPPR